MNKWEYKHLNAYDLGSTAPFNDGILTEELNRLGQDGWEVCGGVYPNLLLKRPKIDEDAGWVPQSNLLFFKMLQEYVELRELQTQALCRDNPGPYKET